MKRAVLVSTTAVPGGAERALTGLARNLRASRASPGTANVSRGTRRKELRPKRTFTLPFDQWLAGRLAATAREAVSRLGDSDVGLDGRVLDRTWLDWEQGRADWRTVWALAALGLWLEQ